MQLSNSDVQVIKPGRLIDGVGGPPREGMAVVLNGSRILWVGPQEELGTRQVPTEVWQTATEGRVLDFPHGTLLPGLIDCHTHTNMPGDGRTGEQVNQDSDDLRLMRSVQNVGRALQSGVTTLCDCGAWNQTAFSLKEGIALGMVTAPRVRVAGRPITITGGHLWFMGGEVDGVDGARKQVRQLIREGADLIKVAATGGSTLTSNPFRPAFRMEELSAITEEAQNLDRFVAAHCRSTVAINYALDAGVDMIFHCFLHDPDGSYRFDQPTAQRLADSGIWVNPTLSVGIGRRESLREKRDQGSLSPEEEVVLNRMEEFEGISTDQFGKLISMGVKLIGGSDAGWSTCRFGDFQGELLGMVKVGLSPIQAILAGTRDTAAAMGIQGSVGTIQAGMEADLLLVEGNPAEDITDLRRVAAVFLGGHQVENAGPFEAIWGDTGS